MRALNSVFGRSVRLWNKPATSAQNEPNKRYPLPFFMRNTKIVVTLGPASDSPECIRALLAAGVNVFRLNASHGDQAGHAKRIETVRKTAADMEIHAAILLDL